MPRLTPAKPETPAGTKAEPPAKRRDTNRDFVEQIVIAFILAFVVRGFEAEAFVIPTGSMAPSLMGAHKDVACPYCGFEFAVNAANEFIEPNNPMSLVASGLCGNCEAPVSLDKDPTFNGDRILVMKYLLNLPVLSQGQPKRWEVIVFHYPGGPETNYIKRLVGLPDEHLRIYFGDILTRKSIEEPFRVERKPLIHQEALQLNVWDDRHRPKALEGRAEWERWRGLNPAWSQTKPGQFKVDAKTQDEWMELRYAHLVPDPAQWNAILAGDPLPYAPKPRLVSDFYAYNAGWHRDRYPDHRFLPRHWVGDLTLATHVELSGSSGALRFELIRGGQINRCEVDLATGQAQMFHGNQDLGEPVATSLKGKGGHDVRFANVDGRLTLWVDGATPFGDGLVYQEGMEGYHTPTVDDLEPARIATLGAKLGVSDLILTRDIYYSLDPHVSESDYQSLGASTEDLLSDPAKFPLMDQLGWKDFHIQPKHYMMLGDNSPRSADARAWRNDDLQWDPNRVRQDYEVPESFLIGKAFYVYWPHGKPFWPSIPFFNPNFRIPFRPNVERMKWIR
jgi:signal peptidase I